MEVSQSDRVTGIPSILKKGVCHCDKMYFYSFLFNKACVKFKHWLILGLLWK